MRVPDVTNLDGVGQGDCHSERQSLGDRHHQDGHADDEELDKILNVDRGALGNPRAALNSEGVDHKVQDEDDDGHGRHDEAWRESAQRVEFKHKYTPWMRRRDVCKARNAVKPATLYKSSGVD